jgi:hypothetical protein
MKTLRSFEKTSEPKQYIRNLLCQLTKEHTAARKILTMPGPEVLDVPLFKQQLNDPIIHCVEKNPVAFNDILDKNVDVHKGTIKEYLDSLVLDQKGFNLVWFDYLGWLQRPIQDDIEALLGNQHLWVESNHACVIAVTLRRDSRHKDREEDLEWLSEHLSNKDVESHNALENRDRQKILTSILRNSDKDHSFEIQSIQEEPFEYENCDGAVPMVFMVFLVIKR